MLLKTFQIHDFQSIRDSNPVEVGDITCLVGKNEAGKTAILRALYRLNPITKGEDKFDVTDDYPRSRVTEYEQQISTGKLQHVIVAAATFTLEDPELKPVEEHFGEGVLPDKSVTLKRGYENKTYFILKADEKIAGEALLATAHLTDAMREENRIWNSLKELAAVLQERATSLEKQVAQATTAANALTDPDEKNQALANAQSMQETAAAKALRTELDTINATGLTKHIYDKFLQPHVPHFLYFDQYYQMRGCENIEALKQRIASGALL